MRWLLRRDHERYLLGRGPAVPVDVRSLSGESGGDGDARPSISIAVSSTSSMFLSSTCCSISGSALGSWARRRLWLRVIIDIDGIVQSQPSD